VTTRGTVDAVAPLTDVNQWLRSDALLIVLYILGAVLLARATTALGNVIIRRIDERARSSDALVRSETEKHRHAVAQVVIWVTTVLIYSIAALLVISHMGVPIAGLVAPATVVGVALGFGAQRIVQDLLAGFFLIAERQYGFGDVIRISQLGSTTGVTGTVEEVTLRITQIRSSNGEVIIVPNGQIVQVTNLSRDWARAVVDVPVPATADLNTMTQVLREVGREAFNDAELRPLMLDPPSIMGAESLSVDELSVRIVARTLPGQQFRVSRELRMRIATALREAGIRVRSDVTAETAQPPT
jgi:small conductance mechanosensitive channel